MSEKTIACQSEPIRFCGNEIEGDFYSPEISLLESGELRICVGGTVITRPIRQWFAAVDEQSVAIPKDRLDRLRNCRKISIADPASVTEPYLRGCANGIILALAILEGREANFIEAPEPKEVAR